MANSGWREGYRRGFQDARPRLPDGVTVDLTCWVCQRYFTLGNGLDQLSADDGLVAFARHLAGHDGSGHYQTMLHVYVPPKGEKT